jgi:hypothetical protein
MPHTNTDRQHHLNELPWQANGSLAANDNQLLDQAIAQDPALQSEKVFVNKLRQNIKQHTDNLPLSDESQSFARLLKQVQNHELAQAKAKSKAKAGSSWLARFVESFQPKYAYGFGLAVICAQFGIIGLMATNTDSDTVFSSTRANAKKAAGNGPFVRVSFKPAAQEADVRFLLVTVGASIVGGPSQLGDYYLYLDPKRTDWAAGQLRNSRIVDTAAVIALLPDAKE